MEISMEMLQKAKAAGSVEELLTMAKESGIELTPEDAEKYYSRLHQNGAVSDEELDNVAGGCMSVNDFVFTCPKCKGHNVVKIGIKYRCNDCRYEFQPSFYDGTAAEK